MGLNLVTTLPNAHHVMLAIFESQISSHTRKTKRRLRFFFANISLMSKPADKSSETPAGTVAAASTSAPAPTSAAVDVRGFEEDDEFEEFEEKGTFDQAICHL